MRTLSGTTSLRALLYIDEMYGLFPPYPRNPPTKDPLLLLLKQGRAFGLGLILATQNPGDLDYKGLSNAGTWFIGKLQTDNDKKRVLTGLEGLANAQSGLDLNDVDRMISQLDPRVFVMHNVHNEGGPTLFHTRWAMSYLRGPLTRTQVADLMAGQKSRVQQRAMPVPGSGGFMPAPPTRDETGQMPAARPAGITGAMPAASALPAARPNIAEPFIPRGSTSSFMSLPEEVPPGATPPPASLPEAPAFLPQQAANQGGGFYAGGGLTQPAQPVSASAPQGTRANQGGLPAGYAYNPPVMPSSIVQYFLPNTIPARTAIANWERQFGFTAQRFGGAELIYRPFLMAQASARYMDRRTGTNAVRQYAFHVPEVPKVGLIHWEHYQAAPVAPRSLAHEPFAQAVFAKCRRGWPTRSA